VSGFQILWAAVRVPEVKSFCSMWGRFSKMIFSSTSEENLGSVEVHF